MRTTFGILLMALMIASASCSNKPASNTFDGVIESIENGKDGYVAILKDTKGGNFEAIFSIPNMGTNYKRWEVGDALKIKGDTFAINNTFRVVAKEAVKE